MTCRAAVKRASAWKFPWRVASGPVALSSLILSLAFPVSLNASGPPLPKQRPSPEAPTRGASTNPVLPLPVAKPGYRPAWAIPSELAKAYGPALDLAERGAWTELSQLDRSPRERSLETVLNWMRLEDGRAQAGFAEIADFLARRKAWPRRRNLVRRAEELMTGKEPVADRLAWFKSNPATTGAGYLQWIAALKETGDATAVAKAARETWSRARFTSSQQKRFLREHRAALGPEDHWRRMDRLLWLGATGPARAMMRLVSPGQRRLAQARLHLRAMSGGVDGAIKRVPETLRSDPGLIYERLRWRHRKGLKDEALELLWDMPETPEFRALWWKERSRQVRYALDSGRLEDAYLLAAGHVQRKGAAFADAQWHAGWIALRYRDKATEAAGYFTDLHARVKTPISRARAAYWAGRALESSGAETAAQSWYARAAVHQTTFYGQLAAEKVPSSIQKLPAAPTPAAAIPTSDGIRELVEIAVALSEIKREKLARRFFREAARAAMSRDEAVWVAASARSRGYLDIGVYTARRAARSGHILSDAGYPLIDVPRRDAPEPALTLAVIRQESGFDEAARSRVGALGLMQLMPATARNVARGLKLPYGRGRLTVDPDYNMRLGSRYLKAQIDRFGGEYVLALAAYNAGPHRVTRWLKERGDPRLGTVDMIDWIERIPFAETRNYVQRVLEAMQVYRLRLGSQETGWRNADAAGAIRNGDCLSSLNEETAPTCAATVVARSR